VAAVTKTGLAPKSATGLAPKSATGLAPKSVKSKKQADLVAAMNERAAALLDASKDGAKVSLETQLAAFSQVGRWIAISNRIADSDADTVGLLDAYRTRIDEAESAVAERAATRIKGINYESGPGYSDKHSGPRYLGRNQRAAKGGTSDNGGAKLDALKARIPRADDGDHAGDRGSSGGEIVVDAGPARIVRSQLPGHAGPESDEGYSSDEF
jgi:hypothetical protein